MITATRLSANWLRLRAAGCGITKRLDRLLDTLTQCIGNQLGCDSARDADISEQPALRATSDRVTRSAERRRRVVMRNPWVESGGF